MLRNEEPGPSIVVIDHDAVSRCIKDPAKHHTHIGALMALCERDDITIYGCTGWMAYLSQLMVSSRYYYLLKDYRFTRRLTTTGAPSMTLYFIEQLYNATTIRDPPCPDGVRPCLVALQCMLAKSLGGTVTGLRKDICQDADWKDLASYCPED